MRQKDSAHMREAGSVAWFLVELLVYAIFVLFYYYLVLNFLGGWLKHLFDEHKGVYAGAALALITAQGILLELFTTWLFKLVRGGKGK